MILVSTTNGKRDERNVSDGTFYTDPGGYSVGNHKSHHSDWGDGGSGGDIGGGSCDFGGGGDGGGGGGGGD